MKLEKARQIVVYKSKRLFHAMCYSGSDKLLNRIIEEEKALQRKGTDEERLTQSRQYITGDTR